ncbi:hypothetical protein ALQ08_103403 [Pseudomonas syringae pv. delphinii]|uniref:Uncharacterized protein n=1 Tax=Pseudomonas syringae pv. delphinii TaxID=192088 RepID=A0A3M4JW26_9PSED|nr:hypothetical protein ALQ28_103240 [Pseudomonas syringae pv. delphinii]RMQ21045.1 hypothetical protein ALQ08_103403 [Pseudomonas syringae pv. delphinii]
MNMFTIKINEKNMISNFIFAAFPTYSAHYQYIYFPSVIHHQKIKYIGSSDTS